MLSHLEPSAVLKGGIPFTLLLLWAAIAVEPDPHAQARAQAQDRAQARAQAQAQSKQNSDGASFETGLKVEASASKLVEAEEESPPIVQTDSKIELIPERTGFLSVHLASHSGEPVVGADVRAIDFFGAEHDLVTDTNGVADFGEVATGSWRLLWHEDGQRVADASRSLVENARLKVLLKNR